MKDEANGSTMGRPSIFRGKLRKHRVQGILTEEGMKQFTLARKRIAALVNWKPAQVSDADVIEALARGTVNVERYLKGEVK